MHPRDADMRSVGRRGTRGFSLLEVLVALAILSIALLALVRSAAGEADSLARERELSQARWVAANVLDEARLDTGLPARGVREGSETLGGRAWQWRLSVSDTPVAGIRRLDVVVFDAAPGADGEPVLLLSGFAGP